MSSIDTLLGRPGEQPRCRVFSADLAVHWYTGHEEGAPCFCGATTRTSEDDDDAPSASTEEATGR